MYRRISVSTTLWVVSLVAMLYWMGEAANGSDKKGNEQGGGANGGQQEDDTHSDGEEAQGHSRDRKVRAQLSQKSRDASNRELKVKKQKKRQQRGATVDLSGDEDQQPKRAIQSYEPTKNKKRSKRQVQLSFPLQVEQIEKMKYQHPQITMSSSQLLQLLNKAFEAVKVQTIQKVQYQLVKDHIRLNSLKSSQASNLIVKLKIAMQNSKLRSKAMKLQHIHKIAIRKQLQVFQKLRLSHVPQAYSTVIMIGAMKSVQRELPQDSVSKQYQEASKRKLQSQKLPIEEDQEAFGSWDNLYDLNKKPTQQLLFEPQYHLYCEKVSNLRGTQGQFTAKSPEKKSTKYTRSLIDLNDSTQSLLRYQERNGVVVIIEKIKSSQKPASPQSNHDSPRESQDSSQSSVFQSETRNNLQSESTRRSVSMKQLRNIFRPANLRSSRSQPALRKSGLAPSAPTHLSPAKPKNKTQKSQLSLRSSAKSRRNSSKAGSLP